MASSAARSARLPAGLLGLLATAACAGAFRPPAPGALAAARAASTYSASLRVRLSGPELRARTGALIAFRRPDALRVEIPGPVGPRSVVVARGGRLLAVFPGERAFFEGLAAPSDLERLLGVGLAPSEMMDLLVGVAVPTLRAYRASWAAGLPRRIEATLPDGGRLRIDVEAAETGSTLPERVFEAPAHDAYRRVDAREARALWSR